MKAEVEFNGCNVTSKKVGTVTVRAVGMYNIFPGGYLSRYTSSNGMTSLYGGAHADDIYYECKGNVNVFLVQKWNYPAFTRIGGPISCPKPECVPTEVAYNPVDKLLYGCFISADKKGYEFGAIDLTLFNSNYNRTTISPIENSWVAMAFTATGQLYVIDIKGDLYTVATATGEMTKIGSTGIVPALATSATFDDVTGTLYWAANSKEGSAIVSLDTKTAKPTVVHEFQYGEQIRGLHIFRQTVADGVPGYAENMKFTFEKGSKTGVVEFNIPSTLNNGNPGSGEVTYTVKIGSTQVASGKASYGSKVSGINVTADAEGVQVGEIVLSNDAGNGPVNKASVYIGYGTPLPVESVSAVYSKGAFNVSWPAVKGSLDGCYVDPEEVTYTVTRLPDNIVVAEKTKQVSISDPVVIPLTPITYSYSVVANNGEKVSTPTVSKGVSLGAIVPPYHVSFDNEGDADEFTIINVDNDATKWEKAKEAMVLPASRTKDMDDWLITPPLSLKAGNAYLLTAEIEGLYVNVKEKFEILAGKSPEPDAMSIKICDAREVINGSAPTERLIIVPEDGMYYVGLHGMSPKGSGALYLNDLKIGEALLLSAPSPVTELKAIPASDASNKVTVSFKTPSLTMDSKPLASLTKVEVMRDNKLMKTFETPATGALLEFGDEPAQSGDVIYNVVPYNSDGKGQSSVIKVYAGVNIPGTPREVTAQELETEGTVKITWKAPGVDAAGFKIDDNLVKYDVYSVISGTRELLAENLTELTFTHKAAEVGSNQKFMQYGVIPKTVKGEGVGAVTSLQPVGTSYELPFKESFSYGGVSYIFGTEVVNGQSANVQWLQCTNGDINKYMSSDGDNGFMAHYAKYTGQSGRLFTGKIKIDAVKPVFWFSTYCINKDHSGVIRIQVKDGGVWKDVKKFVVNELASNESGWVRGIVDLSGYIGKTVQVGIACETGGYAHILIDDIRIFDAKDRDLALVKLDAPLSTEAGKEYSLSLKVENMGLEKVTENNVEVKFDGKTVATAKGSALEPGKSEVMELKFNIPVNAKMTNDLQASVSTASDENISNNSLEPVKVNILSGSLPGVKNLQAVEDQGEVILTWESGENKGTPVTRFGFEEMTSWGNSGSTWSFIDADSSPVTGINGLDLPNVASKSKQSWWVMDNTYEKITEEYDFQANSGVKWLASMARFDAGVCDDWAITPQLTGAEQTVGFFSRSFHGRFPETFEVLYSKSGKETKDFTLLQKIENVPYAWTEYSFRVPEGTKYVAVRHTTKGGFMLYLDDFVYTSVESQNTPLTLVGYHIVADGQQLTEEPVSSTSYKFKGHAGSRVGVYPVYAEGLGSVTEAGVVSEVEAIALDALRISAGEGCIIVEGAIGVDVTVTSASGMLLYRNEGNEMLKIDVPAGIYVVKAGEKVKKLIVR